jgi:lipoate-protein ligase A
VYFEPGKTYNRLHKSITSAYESAGVNFSLLNEKTKTYAVNNPVMDCFLKPVNMDILYNGKKVLGGALRKFGGKMLYQASLQAEDARSNAGFHKNAVLKALGSEFGLNWHTAGADGKTLDGLKALARAKYSCAAWNERI